jgi:hypothetical protein
VASRPWSLAASGAPSPSSLAVPNREICGRRGPKGRARSGRAAHRVMATTQLAHRDDNPAWRIVVTAELWWQQSGRDSPDERAAGGCAGGRAGGRAGGAPRAASHLPEVKAQALAGGLVAVGAAHEVRAVAGAGGAWPRASLSLSAHLNPNALNSSCDRMRLRERSGEYRHLMTDPPAAGGAELREALRQLKVR